MSANAPDPRRTLEELEAARREAERDLEERLAELRRRLDRLDHQARSAEDLVGADQGRQPPDPASLEASTAPPAADAGEQPSRPPPGGLRGRLAHWLLGGRLGALDRRDAAIREGLARLRIELRHLAGEVEARLGRLAEGQQDLHRRLREGIEEDAEAVRIGRQLVEGGSAAIAALIEVQEALRELVEAKDAESRVRAAEGPAAKADLVLEEVRRQQEAILDVLVGRRDELEALVADIRERLSGDR